MFREKENAVKFANEAVQKSVDVLATSTYYTFTCGPVELDVVFTAPQLIDDLDLLSTPINYVSYRVRSLDKKTHDVQFYMETTPELAINESNQPTVARTLSKNGISYVEAGSIDQPICDRRGDLICADWGYAYLASTNGSGKSVSLGDYYGMKESFVKNGTLATTKAKWTTRKEEDNPAMAYVHNLGSVSNSGKEGFMMLGYDDIYSIEYMYEKRMGYWKHDGKVTIFDAFEKLRDNYQAIMERCRAFDELIYDDAEKAGGKKYLSQNASRQEEMRVRQQMDSVYEALREGADFATLARRYSDDEACKNVGGVLPWMPVNKNMQEWIDKLESLERNKISAPFYSPMGIHIVKWIDRRQGVSFEEKREQLLNYLEKNGNCTWKELSAEQKEELEFRVQELQDGLLAAYLSQKYQSGDEAWNEDDLERFFKQHKSDYAWELPHYRGAVIDCKDRKTASAIKKQLKKKPVSQWKDILHTLTGDDASSKVRMEAGVFQIGTNRYIDKLVFKCGSFQPEPDLPYTFVMGKKLKKGPESYEDVREAVVKDYLTVYEDAWLKDLKRKYKVEINQEVLKTVNNNGSN